MKRLRLLAFLALSLFCLSLTTTSAAKRADCFENICVELGDAGGYQLLTVMDTSSGRVLEVFLTRVPSSLVEPARPTGRWHQSAAATGAAKRTGKDAPSGSHIHGAGGPSVPFPVTYTYTYQGIDGYWIVTVTLILDADGNVVDIQTSSVFVRDVETVDP